METDSDSLGFNTSRFGRLNTYWSVEQMTTDMIDLMQEIIRYQCIEEKKKIQQKSSFMYDHNHRGHQGNYIY